MSRKALNQVVCYVFVLLASFSLMASAQTTISYWLWDPAQLEATEEMVKVFESKYDIKVEIQVVPWGEYWDKVPIAVSSGSGPDVYWMTMYNFGMMRDAGLVLNLQPYIDKDPEAADHLDAMWDVLREAYTHEGQVYGFPRDYDTIALLYNEDAVRQAGLAAPMDIDDWWTWDDLLEYAKRLTVRQGDTVTRWGYKAVSWGQQYWYNYIRSNGGDFFNEDGTRSVLASPESVQAIQFMADLRLVHEVAPNSWDGDFASGDLAMENNGSWALKGYVGVTPFDFNIAQLPFSPHTGRRSSNIHGLANVINPLSRNIDAAFTFAKFLASEEAQLILGGTGTVIPSRMDSSYAWFSPDLYPSNRIAFQEAVAYADPYPSSPYLGRNVWQPPTDEIVTQALSGEISVQEAMERAEQLVNVLLEEAMRQR